MTFPVDPKLKDKVREQVAATASQLAALGERRRPRLHQLLLQSRPPDPASPACSAPAATGP